MGDPASPGVRLRDTAHRPETQATKLRAEDASARVPVLPEILQPRPAGLDPQVPDFPTPALGRLVRCV